MTSGYKRIACLALSVLVFCPLFASCDSDEKYPGQNTVTYEVNASDKPIVINVLENEKKFLSCVVTIDITNDNKDDIKLLTEKNHWIRDIIIEIGRSKTLEELQSPDIMEVFGREISDAVSEKFSIDSIYKVSFPTFYLN